MNFPTEFSLSTTALTAIATAVGGWFLHQLGETFRERRERRRVLGETLAELLEIQNQHNATQTVVDKLFNVLSVNSEQRIQVKNALRPLVDSILPSPDETHKRYEACITKLASYDPLLAYELRSKDMFRPFLSKLEALGNSDQNAMSLLHRLEPILETSFRDSLLRLNYSVAWKFGFWTWIKLRIRMKKLSEGPKEIEQIINEVKKALPSTTPTTLS